MYIEKLNNKQIRKIAEKFCNYINDKEYNVIKGNDSIEIEFSQHPTWNCKNNLKITDFTAVKTMHWNNRIHNLEKVDYSKEYRQIMLNTFGEQYKNDFIENARKNKLEKIDEIKKSMENIGQEF